MREPITITQEEWQRDWQGEKGKPRNYPLSGDIVSWIEKHYLAYYAWANRLSIYYSKRYRNSFVWIYLLGVLAVILALLGMATEAHAWESTFILGEAFLIGSILVLTWCGRRQRWHERWIDYRTLAERLRSARFNTLLGGARHRTNIPSHLVTYGNPATTWMHWYARAVERYAGLPKVAVNVAYLSACKELLQEALIGGQEDYHKRNIERLEPIDRQLHWLGGGCFVATAVVCLVHLSDPLLKPSLAHFCGERASETVDRWLTFCAAVFPALGAALAAIRSQGEFHRLIQRSRAMSEELEQLRRSVAQVPTRANELHSRELQQLIEQTTRQMYNEGLDWRIVFQDRPLVLPA